MKKIKRHLSSRDVASAFEQAGPWRFYNAAGRRVTQRSILQSKSRQHKTQVVVMSRQIGVGIEIVLIPHSIWLGYNFFMESSYAAH